LWVHTIGIGALLVGHDERGQAARGLDRNGGRNEPADTANAERVQRIRIARCRAGGHVVDAAALECLPAHCCMSS